MAWIIGDGFDLYGFATDVTVSGLWDSVSGNVGSSGVTGRFTGSKAVSITTTTQNNSLVKTSGSNDAGHHLVFAYNQSGTIYPTAGTNKGLTFGFLDGTAVQCAVLIDANSGAISFWSGDTVTLLGSFAANLPLSSASSWTGIEIEVVIHNTAGSCAVRLNGNTVNDYTLTNVNTRGGTTNNYANKLQIGIGSKGSITGSGNPKIDDFLWFSTSGAAPNTWVGDIRCETKMPGSNVSAGLSGSPSLITNGTVGVSTFTQSAGLLYVAPAITTTVGGSVTSVTVPFSSAFTGHYKLAVYDGSTGTPSTLLGQTAEQTNATGSTLTIPLITPFTVAAGAKLFAVMLADASSTMLATGGVSGASITRAYASGFPADAGSPTLTATTRLTLQVSIVPDNYSQLYEAVIDADTTFVYGATAGLNDLYGLSALTGSPSTIIGVQTRLSSRKSDTGLRTAKIQVKSGATTSNGSTFTMTTGYAYNNKLDVTDPNTAAAWTTSGVNSLQIGPYIVS